MRKLAIALSLSAVGFTSCLAGPHQLKRSVDDYDRSTYVESPWLNAVLWVVPVFPISHFVAGIGDFFIDGWFFWSNDAWDMKGTNFEFSNIADTDGKLKSLKDGWGNFFKKM